MRVNWTQGGWNPIAKILSYEWLYLTSGAHNAIIGTLLNLNSLVSPCLLPMAHVPTPLSWLNFMPANHLIEVPWFWGLLCPRSSITFETLSSQLYEQFTQKLQDRNSILLHIVGPWQPSGILWASMATLELAFCISTKTVSYRQQCCHARLGCLISLNPAVEVCVSFHGWTWENNLLDSSNWEILYA